MTIEQVKAMQWWNRLPEHVKKTLKEKYKSVDYSTGDYLPVKLNDLVDIYAREEHRFPLLQEWEYMILLKVTISNADESLNKYGNQGWELVGVDLHRYLFKRPKQEYIYDEDGGDMEQIP